jgi:hypothetical protein
VLRIEPIGALQAATAGAATVHYAPEPGAEERVHLGVSAGVRLGNVAVSLATGEPIATRLAWSADRASVELEPLDVPVVITASLQCDVPTVAEQAVLTATAGACNERAAFAVCGQPRFLRSRSRLALCADEVGPGSACVLSASCVNDGSATAHDVRLSVCVPDGATIDGPADSWREVDVTGGRHLVVPVGRVDVGERVLREMRVTFAPVAGHGERVAFGGWLGVGDQRFELEPASCTIRSAPKVAAKIRIVENRTYRYGDRVHAVVSVKSRGTDVARDVSVRVTGSGIAWAGSDRDTALVLRFGDLGPHAEASCSIEGVVDASPAGKRSVPVTLRSASSFGSFPCEGSAISVAGASRVTARLVVGPADPSRAHPVDLILSNLGDGIATSVRVAVVPVDGVVGVLDSLSVDGRPRLELDGSLAVVGDGMDVGPVAIRTERRVRWRVRSAAAQRVVLQARVLVDGIAVSAEAAAQLVSGRERTEPADDLESDALAALALAPRAQAPPPVEPPDPQLLAAGDEPEGTTPPDVADSDETADGAPIDARPALRFATSPRAAARWLAWFGEDGPQAQAPLGMYVLALREFLAVGASTAAADAAVAGIRSESEAVVQARLEAYKIHGAFGASGFDFTTPRLRAAVTTLQALLDRPAVEADAMDLERAICALAGAEGTPLAQGVTRVRDAVAAALDAIGTPDALGEDAPGVLASARALFDQLMEAMVRA